MIIRKLEQSEHIATRKLWEEIFPEDTKAFLDYYYYIKAAKNQIYVVEEDGRICSMLQLNPYRIRLEDKSFPSEYIVAVATKKEYRSRGLGGGGGGDVQPLDARPPGGQGHGQHPHHRPQGAGQRQLPHVGAVRPVQPELPPGGQNTRQNGQIVHRAPLALVGGSQVDRDAGHREGEAAVFNGGAHPVPKYRFPGFIGRGTIILKILPQRCPLLPVSVQSM